LGKRAKCRTKESIKEVVGTWKMERNEVGSAMQDF
jgi:hypothetical protein